ALTPSGGSCRAKIEAEHGRHPLEVIRIGRPFADARLGFRRKLAPDRYELLSRVVDDRLEQLLAPRDVMRLAPLEHRAQPVDARLQAHGAKLVEQRVEPGKRRPIPTFLDELLGAIGLASGERVACGREITLGDSA